MPAKLLCPKCQKAGLPTVDDDLFYCRSCKAFFDDDPDEGGTYHDANAAARLEREERARADRLRRLGGMR